MNSALTQRKAGCFKNSPLNLEFFLRFQTFRSMAIHTPFTCLDTCHAVAVAPGVSHLTVKLRVWAEPVKGKGNHKVGGWSLSSGGGVRGDSRTFFYGGWQKRNHNSNRGTDPIITLPMICCESENDRGGTLQGPISLQQGLVP